MDNDKLGQDISWELEPEKKLKKILPSDEVFINEKYLSLPDSDKKIIQQEYLTAVNDKWKAITEDPKFGMLPFQDKEIITQEFNKRFSADISSTIPIKTTLTPSALETMLPYEQEKARQLLNEGSRIVLHDTKQLYNFSKIYSEAVWQTLLNPFNTKQVKSKWENVEKFTKHPDWQETAGRLETLAGLAMLGYMVYGGAQDISNAIKWNKFLKEYTQPKGYVPSPVKEGEVVPMRPVSHPEEVPAKPKELTAPVPKLVGKVQEEDIKREQEFLRILGFSPKNPPKSAKEIQSAVSQKTLEYTPLVRDGKVIKEGDIDLLKKIEEGWKTYQQLQQRYYSELDKLPDPKGISSVIKFWNEKVSPPKLTQEQRIRTQLLAKQLNIPVIEQRIDLPAMQKVLTQTAASISTKSTAGEKLFKELATNAFQMRPQYWINEFRNGEFYRWAAQTGLAKATDMTPADIFWKWASRNKEVRKEIVADPTFREATEEIVSAIPTGAGKGVAAEVGKVAGKEAGVGKEAVEVPVSKEVVKEAVSKEKVVSGVPKVEGKVPAPKTQFVKTNQKEEYRPLMEIEAPEGEKVDYFTDKIVIIKGTPPKGVSKSNEGVNLSAVKELLSQPTKPAKFLYYGIDSTDLQGVSPYPVVSAGKESIPFTVSKPFTVFKSGDTVRAYNQYYINAITKRFPNATYGISENNDILIAYDKGEPVAAVMPLKDFKKEDILYPMASEQGLTEEKNRPETGYWKEKEAIVRKKPTYEIVRKRPAYETREIIHNYEQVVKQIDEAIKVAPDETDKTIPFQIDGTKFNIIGTKQNLLDFKKEVEKARVIKVPKSQTLKSLQSLARTAQATQAKQKESIARKSEYIRMVFEEPDYFTQLDNYVSTGKVDKKIEEKIIKRTEIARQVSEKLGVPIKLGHFREKGALGVYKQGKKIIRVKSPVDIPTIAHEVGHYLYEQLSPDVKNYYDELSKFISPRAKGEKKLLQQEAFCEFMNYYITKPELAKKVAPSFYGYWEEWCPTEIKNVLLEAQKDYQNWKKMSPVAKLQSQISYVDERQHLSFRDNLSKLYTAIFDDLHPIFKLMVEPIEKAIGEPLPPSMNPYMLARLTRGEVGFAETWLEWGQYDMYFNRLELSLREILTPISKNYKEFNTYLVARRILERKEPIRIGLDRATIKEAASMLERQHPEFLKAAKEINDYCDNLLTLMVQSEIITPEDKIRMQQVNPFYVPLQRVLEAVTTSGKRPAAKAGQFLKTIKGSEREIIAPVESIIKNTYIISHICHINQVKIAMAKLAEMYPGEVGQRIEKIPPDMAKVATLSPQEIVSIGKKFGIYPTPTTGVIPESLAITETPVFVSKEALEMTFNIFRTSFVSFRPNTMEVYIKGKKQLYDVDPQLYEALNMIDRESLGLVIRMLSYPARMLRLGAVALAPEFWARNPLRDLITASGLTETGMIPVDAVKGLFSAVGRDDYYWKWKLAGGEFAAFVSLDRNTNAKTVKELLSKHPFITQTLVKNPAEAMRVVSEIGEQMTRLTEFRLSLENPGRWRLGAKKIPKNWTEYDKILQAAYNSREVTLDFARMGSKVKAINSIIAFWSPAMQDIDKFSRAMKAHPIRTSLKYLIWITLASVLLWRAQHDTKEYKEIPQWEKDVFWIVITDKGIYRFPKPFLAGILFGSLPERVLDYIKENDPELFKQYMRDLGNQISPGMIPTAILGPMEVASNYSFFVERPIVSMAYQGLPPELQYNYYTSEVAKAVGKAINVSPMKIDHFIKSWSGGGGKLAVEIMDQMLISTGLIEDKKFSSLFHPATPADIPLVRGFVVREPVGTSSESVSKFYINLERAETGWKVLKEERLTDKEIQEYKKKYPEYVCVKQLRKINKQLSELRKKRTEIMYSKELGKKEKIEECYKIDAQMTAWAKMGNEIVKKRMKELGLK